MKILKRIIVAIFLIITAIIILMPFAWMVSISFRPDDEVLRFPPTLLGGEFTLSNYPRFFEEFPFARAFGNSVFVGIAITLASTFTSMLAGFAFAKYSFKGKNVIFMALMATIMIPVFVILIPLYLVIIKLNWLDTYYALIIPFLATPFGIFMMRQFIYSIPDELMYAARIDGCTEFGIFGKIITPLIMPATASLLIIEFMGQWDSLLWPVIVTNSEKFRTLPVALSVMVHSMYRTSDWNLCMVGTFISTAPILIMYLALQRLFIDSITMVGLKE